jgi:hypothetical protein
MSGGLVTGCSKPKEDAADRAVLSPSIETALKSMSDAEMLPVAKQLVASMRRADPHVSGADLVNDATTAYCHVLHDDHSLDNVTRAARIGQFSELVYMESNPHNHALH